MVAAKIAQTERLEKQREAQQRAKAKRLEYLLSKAQAFTGLVESMMFSKDGAENDDSGAAGNTRKGSARKSPGKVGKDSSVYAR
jgi:hypothetical protein